MQRITRRTAIKGGVGAALLVAFSSFTSPATAAAGNRVRVSKGRSYAPGATSMAMAFPAPAAGNLLLAVVGVDKKAGTFTAPSGWTLAFQQAGTSVSLAAMYRVATGSETSAAPRWSTASSGGSWLVAEYTGINTGDPLGPVRVAPYSDTARSSMSLNPATAEASSIALAVFAIDSMNAKTAGDTGGGEFRPTASGWNWIETSYDGAQGSCPGTALAEHGAGLASAVNLPTTTFRWSRKDQVAGATLLLNTGTASASTSSATLVSRWVGGVTASGATVAAKVAKASSVRLKVATDAALTAGVTYSPATTPDAQGLVKLTVSGLAAGTQHYYAVEADGRVDTAKTGSFRTAPAGAGDFTFAFASCCNTPSSNTFSAIRGRNPDLFIHMGDLHYADISTNDPAAFRAQYDIALASAHQGPLYATVPTTYTWSDHDFGPNGSNGSSASKPAAQATYRQYVPSHALPSASGGIYHTFVYGRVRFVVTDNRSYKSSQSASDGSAKTVLGAEQKQWFKNVISTASEPLVIWVNELPWIGAKSSGADHWAGYTTERDELARHISASGKKVAIISGDMHALAADDGSRSPGGIPVFHAAPLHKTSSQKGGPYGVGPYPSTSGAAVQQYGLMRVKDTGSQITLAFTGYDVGGASRISLTKTFAV